MKLRRPRAVTCAVAAALAFGATTGTALLSGTAVAAPLVHGDHVARNAVSDATAQVAADGSATLTWTAGDRVHDVRVYASVNPVAPFLTGRLVAVVKAGTTTVTVTGLDPAQRWYFSVLPDGAPGRGVEVAPRGVGLQAAANTRDLGGYKTADGFTVRYGKVFRSDALNKLTAADLTKLQNMGLKQVEDFRTDFEVNLNGPDLVPSGATLQRVPVSDGGMYSQLNQVIASRNPVTQEEMLGNGKAEQLLIDANKSFVDDPAQRAQFAQVLRQIADGQTTLFNCSAGKDRTGWMSAILLTALGVPKATVYQDYLASNQFLAANNARTKAGLKAAGLMQDPDLLDPLLGVESQYLDAAFGEVAAKYGTFTQFLHDGLGIDNATLAKLRARMLTIS